MADTTTMPIATTHTKMKSMPSPTLKSSKFRSSTLKSSQIWPPTQKTCQSIPSQNMSFSTCPQKPSHFRFPQKKQVNFDAPTQKQNKFRPSTQKPSQFLCQHWNRCSFDRPLWNQFFRPPIQNQVDFDVHAKTTSCSTRRQKRSLFRPPTQKPS